MGGGVPAVVVEPLLAGSGEALSAGLADLFSSSLVFVVGCDVADRFVQPHRVVLDPDAGELGFEHDGIGDVFEVGPLALDVTEEGLDPRLVGRGVGAPVVLGDGEERHERPGVVRGHLGAVVGHGEQDRTGPVVLAEVDPPILVVAALDGLE